MITNPIVRHMVGIPLILAKKKKGKKRRGGRRGTEDRALLRACTPYPHRFQHFLEKGKKGGKKEGKERRRRGDTRSDCGKLALLASIHDDVECTRRLQKKRRGGRPIPCSKLIPSTIDLPARMSLPSRAVRQGKGKKREEKGKSRLRRSTLAPSVIHGRFLVLFKVCIVGGKGKEKKGKKEGKGKASASTPSHAISALFCSECGRAGTGGKRRGRDHTGIPSKPPRLPPVFNRPSSFIRDSPSRGGGERKEGEDQKPRSNRSRREPRKRARWKRNRQGERGGGKGEGPGYSSDKNKPHLITQSSSTGKKKKKKKAGAQRRPRVASWQASTLEYAVVPLREKEKKGEGEREKGRVSQQQTSWPGSRHSSHLNFRAPGRVLVGEKKGRKRGGEDGRIASLGPIPREDHS